MLKGTPQLRKHPVSVSGYVCGCVSDNRDFSKIPFISTFACVSVISENFINNYL
jgi:hypothetical protein